MIALLGVLGFFIAFAGVPLMDHGHPLLAWACCIVGLVLLSIAVVADVREEEDDG